MRQDVYEDLAFSALDDHFDAIEACAYSIYLFTDWGGDQFPQVWFKRKSEPGVLVTASDDFYGATCASCDRHPIPGVSAKNCTSQMGVAGPWYERLPHFRMDFPPSSGKELQSEYFVPRDHAVAARRAVARLGPSIHPLLLV